MIPARSSAWEGRLSTATAITKQIKLMLFGLHADQASHEALSAEIVRVALWTQSVYKPAASLSEAAITTRRLLDQARAFWTPIQDAYRESMITKASQSLSARSKSKSDMEIELKIDRELLDILNDQGDILSLQGGYWVPSPLRLVPLAATRYLLVGGIPTHLLPDTLLQALTLRGSFRHIENNKIAALSTNTEEHTVVWQTQSPESWLGPSPPSLESLVHSFDVHELYSVIHQSDSSLEAYAAYVNEPQYLRWHSLDYVEDGRYLLRTSTPWGTRQYSVGYIRHHNLTEQSAELREMDIRRLCYALDKRTGKPTRARWSARRGELILNSELPGRERKYLSSIGFLQENKDSYYPRRWVGIDSIYSGSIKTYLNQLGIQIDSF